jgi:succinylarginine dihydrolase
MWAANAATVSPSSDTADARVHFTPANLPTQFHRSLETAQTGKILRKILADESAFAHHEPLQAGSYFSDEGAANHMRFSSAYGEKGTEVFVYGRSATQPAATSFPARQTLEASQAIARLHGLDPNRTHFVQQNPQAIDAGAFHNDVVAVSNLNVLLYHERAFADKSWIPKDVVAIEIPEARVPLEDAVSSYLFNCQIVGTDPMELVAPIESRENFKVFRYLGAMVSRNPTIKRVHFVDIRQSMQNGGGPACLRLRVVLTERELSLIRPRVLLDRALYSELTDWITRNYREKLVPADLADPTLLDESRRALDELMKILQLGSIYPFQAASLIPSPGTPGERLS